MWWTSKQILFKCVYNFVHLCRIEAMEKKHNREWEEDYGTDRPKSPKSSPKVPSPRTTPTPKAKSSRKDRQQCLLFKMHESCVSFWNQRGARVLLHSPSFSALSLSLPLLCAVLLFMTSSLCWWSQLFRWGRWGRWGGWGGRGGQRSECGASADIVTAVVGGCLREAANAKTSAGFPLPITVSQWESYVCIITPAVFLFFFSW